MISYNKILNHRTYRIDFDKGLVICQKCNHKCDIRTFANSLLMFECKSANPLALSKRKNKTDFAKKSKNKTDFKKSSEVRIMEKCV